MIVDIGRKHCDKIGLSPLNAPHKVDLGERTQFKVPFLDSPVEQPPVTGDSGTRFGPDPGKELLNPLCIQ